MGDKIVNLLIDIVKYVFTIMLVYPILSGMEKNWEYYTIVGVAVAGGMALALLVRHIDKKHGEKKTDPKCNRKYKYKYKFKSKHQSKN
jgi:hypothetical protein